MFHDLNLHNLADSATLKAFCDTSFELTDQANSLMLMVQFYKSQGYTSLPVAQIKRDTGWGADKWRNATKGNPSARGHRKNGLEATGLISQATFKCPKTGKIITQWLIGEYCPEKVEQLKEQREEALKNEPEPEVVIERTDPQELSDDQAIVHLPTFRKRIEELKQIEREKCAHMAVEHGEREFKRGYTSGTVDASIEYEKLIADLQNPDCVFPSPNIKGYLGAGKTGSGGQ